MCRLRRRAAGKSAETSTCERISARYQCRLGSPQASAEPWSRCLDRICRGAKTFLSVLSIGELRIGITIQSDVKKRAALETWLISDLLSRFAGRILPFDLEVAQEWGRIEGRARRETGKLPVIDSQLAATALHHGLTLVTNNESDFSRTGASILNPWT